MSVTQLAEMTDVSRRARWRRGRRVIIGLVAFLLVISAFLIWGPIGLGNGPVSVEMGGSNGWTDTGETPVAFILALYNSGSSPAVVDSVDLVGRTRYGTPRLMHVEVLTQSICAGAWATRSDGNGFALDDCPEARDEGSLLGRGIGPHTAPDSRGFLVAAIATAPPPGTCWVITEIVVHYHVGIRHFASTSQYELAVCGRGADKQVAPAMDAAGIAG